MSSDRVIMHGRAGVKRSPNPSPSPLRRASETIESRLSKLEIQVEHISHDVSSLEVDTKDVRDRAIRIEERVSHLPSFLQMVSMLAALLALIAALTLYQDNLKRAFGAMSSPAPAAAGRAQ